MVIAELWRYPVKSMAGEPLRAADLGADGIRGDRLVQVRDGRGGIITSRTRPRLLGLRATLGDDGEPRIDGRAWTSPESAAAVRAAAGDDARLVRAGPEDRFDVLPLLVATDGALAHLTLDRRRLRPNILLGGVPGLAERSWPGRHLAAGGAVIALVSLRQRCVMTTFDPDTLVQDSTVLRGIQERLGGRMALDCEVVQAGWIEVGDEARLI